LSFNVSWQFVVVIQRVSSCPCSCEGGEKWLGGSLHRDWWWNIHCNLTCLELMDWWSFRAQEGITAIVLFPQFDGFSYILFIFSATPTPPSVFPLVPCCTKTGNAPPDTSLACLVTGYFPSPVEIKWNSGKVTQGVTTFPEVTMSNGRFTQSSLLIIPARSRQGNTNQCDVTHQGTATILLKKFPQEGKTPGCVPCTPAVLGHLLKWIQAQSRKPRHSGVRTSTGVNRLISAEVASSITWKVDGQVSSVAKTEPPKKNSNGTTSLVSSHPVSLAQWGEGTQFTCKVTTPCSGELTQDITMSNTGEEPWHLKGKVTISRAYHEDTSGNRVSLTLICEASGFYPEEISISWLKNNSPELKSSYNNGPVSGSGTFSAYSILKVEQSQEEGNYTCVVHHPAMEEPKTVVEKVSHGKWILRGRY
uniref:Ig-like domain-containing protein n=1 Tax=Chelonoidis abingdonii TaxID=106734 RepID=A0A8C0QPL3_CHEAB